MSDAILHSIPTLPPGLYRHYKGRNYTVIGVARHSESLDPVVVYRAEYGERGLWVRDYTMFTETVFFNGEEVPRFVRVGDPGDEIPNEAAPSAVDATAYAAPTPTTSFMHDSTPPPLLPGESPLDRPPNDNERMLAVLAYVLTAISGFIGPLIIWLIEKDKKNFAAQEAKEALNFSITVLILFFGGAILAILPFVNCLVIPLLMAGGIAATVLCILGAIKASEGREYRFPVNFRFIR